MNDADDEREYKLKLEDCASREREFMRAPVSFTVRDVLVTLFESAMYVVLVFLMAECSCGACISKTIITGAP